MKLPDMQKFVDAFIEANPDLIKDGFNFSVEESGSWHMELYVYYDRLTKSKRYHIRSLSSARFDVQGFVATELKNMVEELRKFNGDN